MLTLFSHLCAVLPSKFNRAFLRKEFATEHVDGLAVSQPRGLVTVQTPSRSTRMDWIDENGLDRSTITTLPILISLGVLWRNTLSSRFVNETGTLRDQYEG